MPPDPIPESASPETSDSARKRRSRTGAGFSDAVQTFQLPFYGRLWTSNLIQFVCLHVLFLAMQWLVTSISDMRLAVGMIAFIQGGTIALVSPMAGVVVDRQPKRELIIYGRLGLAAVASSIGLLVYTDVIAYWQLLVVSIVGGIIAAVLNPATQTFVVDVVGRNRTEHAVSLNAIGSSFGTIGGGALAGVLVGALGMVATFWSAAAGVVLAALVVMSIPIRGQVTRQERTSLRADLKAGFAYVRANPPILLALLACSMAIFNGAIAPMRVIFARYVLEVDAEAFGLMSAVHGAGTLIAAGYVTLFPPKGRFGLLIAGTMFLFAMGLLLYSFAFSFGYLLAVDFFLGFSGQLWHISAMIGFQLAVPEEMRGRVLSMLFTLAQLGFVGALLVTGLADLVGDQLALGIFGVIPTVALGFLLVFGWKTLRRMGSLQDT